MQLRDLIKFLKGVDPAKVCRFGFKNPHSYRGYYEDIAFEPAENVTVGDMLAAAESSLGKTFEGYKGGEFEMGEYTDCWLANYGDGGGEGIGPMLLQYITSDAESALAAMRQRAEEAEKDINKMYRDVDEAYASNRALVKERDAALARAERAEACLRDAVSKLKQVKEYLEDYFEGTRDHRYIGIQCIIEIGVKRITNTLTDAVLSSPPADASTMGGDHIADNRNMVGGRDQRLADSLDEILNYSGGADNALEDEYVMDRARAALENHER